MFASIARFIGREQITAAETEEGVMERRAYARAQVSFDVVVRLGARRVTGQLRDVSISGAMLSVALPLKMGDQVQLTIERLDAPIQAKVVRRSGGCFGLAFDDPGIGVLLAGWSRGASVANRSNRSESG
jgi:hypothetical protein